VERHPDIPAVPWPRQGAFGAVFKIKGNSTAYALKVFYRPQPDRQTRYQLIDSYLKGIRMPRRLVSFDYDDNGISVRGKTYPTLIMDWADGFALDAYLDQRLAARGVDNGRECREWVATLRELQSATIAHGDLQHKNILVRPGGRFRLVDYDGMFVPGMEQLNPCEAGVSAYQHPQRTRTAGHFDERMDNFSALVILLTLACVNAELWSLYHKDGRLLLSEEDLQDPDDSKLLKLLAGRPGPIGALAGIVKEAAKGGLDEVPSFASVVSGLGTQWMAGPARRASPIQPPQPAEPAGTSRPAAALVGEDGLTDRQRQVARLLASGGSEASIASALGLRPAKVRQHIAEMKKKATGQGAESLKPVVAKYDRPVERPTVPRSALTPTQHKVLGLLREGLIPEQIASRLHMQRPNVNRHLASIRAVVGDDELDTLLTQAAAKESPRLAATTKAATKKSAERKPTPRQPAKTAAGQTAPASASAPSPRDKVPARHTSRVPRAPAPKSAAPLRLRLPETQPTRPVSPRQAARPPSHRRPSSPGRSRTAAVATFFIVALIVFVILTVVGALLH
jgi:DNA-binding CsgD family transcriptional regulator